MVASMIRAEAPSTNEAPASSRKLRLWFAVDSGRISLSK
jgi:hypothetical protein